MIPPAMSPTKIASRMVATAAVALFSSLSLIAQGQVLVLGTAVDEKTGAPVYCAYKIEAKDSDKKWVGKTVKADGSFKQLLESNKEYTVTFTGDNIIRTPRAFKTIYADNFTEEKHTFKVRTVKKGDVAYTFNGFAPMSAELTPAMKQDLQKMFEDIKSNRALRVAVRVGATSADVPAPPPPPPAADKKDKKKDKKKKQEATPAPPPAPTVTADEVAAKRMAAVRDYLASLGDDATMKRISVEDAKGTQSSHVSVTVTEIRGLFE